MSSQAHKLILDVAGGDFAPLAILDGATQALGELSSCSTQLILIGNQDVIKKHLNRRRFKSLLKTEIVHASEEIEMTDSVKAIRAKPNSSLNMGIKLAAQDFKSGLSTGFVSAGHSGAVMASAFLNMGRIAGISRPSIAVTLPNLTRRGTLLVDAGANVECTAENLRDFAVMAAALVSARFPGHFPRIALLSNGEEDSKGTPLTRDALQLIRSDSRFQGEKNNAKKPIANFLGYAEGKQMFKGDVDAFITDGFTGNVVLKSVEGLGLTISKMIKSEGMSNPLNILGFLIANSALRRVKRRLDYSEYGAAPLLGVDGYAFICHGNSNGKAIKNALLRAQSTLKGRFVERLKEANI